MKTWLRSAFELGDHNRRLPSMEGLRGLAILLVFASHYNDIIGVHLALPQHVAAVSNAIGVIGGLGVDLFFLLSGFLIYRTTLKANLNVGSFLLRRAERIYPTFLVVFVCFLVLGALHLGPSRVTGGLGHKALTIVQNLLFLPGIFDLPAVISAAWSLSYEWFFYLVLPLIVVAGRLRHWSRVQRVVAFAVLCGFYESLCLFAPHLFPTFANYEGSHVRLLMFVAGMIVYELLESERFRRFFTPRIERTALAVAGLCAVALIVRIASSPVTSTVDGAWSSSSAAFQVIPTFFGYGCLGLVVLRNDGPLAAFFSMTWLRWIGNISYSFYLVHSIPMHFVALLLGKAARHANPVALYALALPFTLALTVAVSAVLFLSVEKPLSLRPRRAAGPQPVAPVHAPLAALPEGAVPAVPSGRIVALDGIRALAIALVLWAHSWETPLGGAIGTLGVSLFFVLSGYLITSLLLKERARTGKIDLRAFYERRVRRIFPAYYIYLLAIVGTTILGWTQVDPRAFFYDFLYLKNYAFNVPVDWWTGHSWSLCIEEQFYVIWPLLLVFGGLKLGWRFAVGCIVAAPVLRVATYFALPHQRDFISVMLPTRVDIIMFGCALAIVAAKYPISLAWLTRRRVEIALGGLALASIAGLFLTARYRGLYAFPVGDTITGLGGTALILYVVRYPASLVANVLSLAPVAWIGRISYSLYLWQQPFLTPGLNHSLSGRFPLNIIAAFAMATVSYYVVERRFFVAVPLQARAPVTPAVTSGTQAQPALL